MKLAACLSELVAWHPARKIRTIEEQLAAKECSLNGRQFLWLMDESFKLNEVDGGILKFDDLLHVKLQNDSLQQILDDWENVLAGMRKIPADEWLETLFRGQLELSAQFKQTLMLYEVSCMQEEKPRYYERFLSMLRSYLAKQRHDFNKKSFWISNAHDNFLI